MEEVGRRVVLVTGAASGVGATLVFLLSAEAAYITGQAVHVAGGLSL